MKENLRKYGKAPFGVAVIHGGPGAPGEMAPVARELSLVRGILEPLQTAASLDGQVEELNLILKRSADVPIILIGWSWGAMLSFIFTARNPSLIKKLILIGSAPYREEYAANIMQTRLSRLDEKDRIEVVVLMKALDSTATISKNVLLRRFADLMSGADSFNPLPSVSEILECEYEINEKVWHQASELRKSGSLLELGRHIHCPVVAIHGDYDPHPFEGVRVPLSGVLKDFHFVLLKYCGHRPWIERLAKDRFYDVLKNEIE